MKLALLLAKRVVWVASRVLTFTPRLNLRNRILIQISKPSTANNHYQGVSFPPPALIRFMYVDILTDWHDSIEPTTHHTRFTVG